MQEIYLNSIIISPIKLFTNITIIELIIDWNLMIDLHRGRMILFPSVEVMMNLVIWETVFVGDGAFGFFPRKFIWVTVVPNAKTVRMSICDIRMRPAFGFGLATWKVVKDLVSQVMLELSSTFFLMPMPILS